MERLLGEGDLGTGPMDPDSIEMRNQWRRDVADTVGSPESQMDVIAGVIGRPPDSEIGNLPGSSEYFVFSDSPDGQSFKTVVRESLSPQPIDQE